MDFKENIIDVGDNCKQAVTSALKYAANRLTRIGDDVYGKRLEYESWESMKILGYHIANGAIVNSNNEVVTNSPYLEFLLTPKEDTIRVVFNLDYSIANLLKMIEIEEIEGHELNNETYLTIHPYKLRYIPHKFFSAKRIEHFVYYSDTQQYAKNNSELLNKDPLELAQLAKEIGEKVYVSLVELGLYPKSITSPIRPYEAEIMTKSDLPTIDNIPEQAGLFAYNCCKGNWIETYKIGHFPMAYDYDINSAYPNEIKNLLNIKYGTWANSAKWQDKAHYGFCKCKVNITSEFSPIIYEAKTTSRGDVKNYTPVGSWETYLTNSEIKFIHDYSIGKVEILDGWWWTPNKIKMSLRDQIEWLYIEKMKANGNKNSIKKEVIKRIMSGIYGKMLEVRRGEFGEWFNPVWGAIIETNTRLEVAKFAIENKQIPIHVAVDGASFEKKIDIDVEQSYKIGGWRLNSVEPCLVIGSGVVAIKNREKTGDFSLDYDWLIKEIEKTPSNRQYVMNKISPVTLAVACNLRKWNELGNLKRINKSVDIGYEEKRCYEQIPICGSDLMSKIYESSTWDVGTLVGKEYLGNT